MLNKYIESLESIKLLPYSYKRYGYIVLVLSVPIALGIIYSVNSIWVIENRKAFWGESPIIIFFNSLIAIGLSLLVFSKEKIEDEMVRALRFKSFLYGVYMFVIAILAFPLFSNITILVTGAPMQLKDLGGHAALNLLLLGVLITFRVRMLLERKRP